jgi:hypothetical protein
VLAIVGGVGSWSVNLKICEDLVEILMPKAATAESYMPSIKGYDITIEPFRTVDYKYSFGRRDQLGLYIGG